MTIRQSASWLTLAEKPRRVGTEGPLSLGKYDIGLITISESAQRVAAFQSPITILPPRIARFSARLSW